MHKVTPSRDIVEYSQRRKLEDVRDVKADHKQGIRISLNSVNIIAGDWLSGVRYTASVSQTGKEMR